MFHKIERSCKPCSWHDSLYRFWFYFRVWVSRSYFKFSDTCQYTKLFIKFKLKLDFFLIILKRQRNSQANLYIHRLFLYSDNVSEQRENNGREMIFRKIRVNVPSSKVVFFSHVQTRISLTHYSVLVLVEW